MRVRVGLTMLVIVTIAAVGCGADAGDGATSPRERTSDSESSSATVNPPETTSTPSEETDVATTPPPEPSPTPSGSPPTGKPGTTFALRGVVKEGVEAGCLLLDEYLLVMSRPNEFDLVKPGARVEVTGYVDRSVSSFCQQGTPFVVTAAVPITAPG